MAVTPGQTTPIPSGNIAAWNRHHAGALGTELSHKCHVVKGIYDFSVDGGAVGTTYLKDENGNEINLPSGAIIKQVFTYEATNVTTSASGTLSFGVEGVAVDTLLTATAAASFSGIQAGTQTGVAANMTRLSADGKLTASIATGALTAGKVFVFVEFVSL
jgi:type V secretory pathway adhesin AidA